MKAFFPVTLGCCLLATTLTLAHAGELKVDINRDSKNLDSATEVGYTKWSQDTTGGAATGTNAIPKSFTNAVGELITIRFAQTQASADRGGTGLLSNWYQTGAQGTAKLVSDGISVAPASLATGGEIQMTITGLLPGHHTLLTYHNQWDATNNGGLPTFSGPIDIYLNGTQVVDNLQPSIRAANNLAAPIAYLEFDVANTSDVTTILFAAETNTVSPVTIKNPMINGFEIDTPNSLRTANSPSPADGDEHVDADAGSVSLIWSPALASNAVSHDVYIGTNLTALKNAGHASPEFKGSQTGTNYTATGLNSLLTYYWRIDEVDAIGNATKGTVWMFRPRHLAFPGAEGYGRFARGGRGGVVVEVTNLNDGGPGSLRHAITNNYGPRTIVFTVSGLITLESRLVLNAPNITIAGQTAPGKGICVKQWTMGLSGASDAVIRFIRSRPGRTLQTITVDKYSNGTTGTPTSATAAVAVDGMGMQGSSHSIIDHCSISWTIDEAFSSRSAKNITLQRTLISEALNKALHPNYIFLDNFAGTEHGYAASVGGDIGSFHHNLLAHCYGRNWSMAGGLDASATFAGRLDFNNNVVYNWGSRTTDGGAMEVDFVGNYYKPGAGTTLVPYALTMNHEDNFAGSQRCYFAGNVMPGYFDESNQTVGRRSLVDSGVPTPSYETFVATPFFASCVTTQTALGAYKQVLSDSGCNQPFFDDHDARIVRETLDGTYTYNGSVTGKHGFPDVETDVGGWEDYGNETRPANWDADHDGLPDWWEQIKGFNPNSAAGDFSESNSDLDGDGYTALEDYLNWLAAPHVDCSAGSYVDIDLGALTRGFTNNSPRYAVFSAINGTVVTNGNGRTARFTPAANTNSLAGFTFSVADANGYNMTNTIGVRVMTAVANSAPAFSTVSSDRFINVGVTLLATNTATDVDADQTLTYSLPVKPTNATIDSATGIINWRPLVTQAGTTNPFSVVVADNGSPSLSATQSFNVIVNPLTTPSIVAPPIANGQIGLTVSGQVGPDYAVQSSSNLLDWTTLLITNPASMPFTWSTNTGALPAQYYRIKVGPPLP